MTSKSDVWSFSMTVFEMMTLEKPYGAITKDQVNFVCILSLIIVECLAYKKLLF